MNAWRGGRGAAPPNHTFEGAWLLIQWKSNMRPIHSIVIASSLVGLSCAQAIGEVIEFEEKADWIDSVGEFTTIGFNDLPDGTWVFEQYAHLGAHFVDGADIVLCCSEVVFPEDGAGLDGNSEIRVTFDMPLWYVAIDYPGTAQFELFDGGELIYTSSPFYGDDLSGNFAGLLSTEMFDEVRITDPVGSEVVLDDLHFGPPIPAPGALSLLALGFIGSTRRRRT
jgi:MYXO-CTERM domain-containing protein